MMGRTEFAAMAERTLGSYIESSPKQVGTRVVRMTSGTSGRPLVFIRELPPYAPGWFAGAKAAALCGGSLPWRLGLIHFFLQDAEPDARLLVIDGSDLSFDLEPLLADLQPEVLAGFPSFLARMPAYIDRPTAQGVRGLMMTGELLREPVRALFQEAFPNARVAPQYLIQELGYVGSPAYCARLPLHHYHPAEGVEVRVLEPESDGVGEIAITSVFNEIIRLDDYHYGDMGRVWQRPCACGATQEFEIVGRQGHDFIRTAGVVIRREEFDRVAGLCAKWFDDYRVEVRDLLLDGVVKAHLTLRVYRKEGSGDERVVAEITRRVTQELFLTPTQTLADLIQKNTFLPLVVQFQTESFPVKHKDLKLQHRND